MPNSSKWIAMPPFYRLKTKQGAKKLQTTPTFLYSNKSRITLRHLRIYLRRLRVGKTVLGSNSSIRFQVSNSPLVNLGMAVATSRCTVAWQLNRSTSEASKRLNLTIRQACTSSTIETRLAACSNNSWTSLKKSSSSLSHLDCQVIWTTCSITISMAKQSPISSNIRGRTTKVRQQEPQKLRQKRFWLWQLKLERGEMKTS